MYTPEQFERLQAWAASAESGAAMKHLWSPREGAFLQRYASTTTNTVRPATMTKPWREKTRGGCNCFRDREKDTYGTCS